VKENSRHELIIGGTGGQGVITIGYVIAAAAAERYRYVTRFPIYLATMRGGPAFCTVIFSNSEIAAPILSHAENAIAMESGAYSRLKKEVKPGGRLLVNSSVVTKIEPAANFQVVAVPVTDLAQAMGKTQMANIIMLGAYCELTGIFSEEELLEAIRKELLEEEDADLLALNRAALQKGAESVRKEKGA
jgi:2-oxoglutarate ferredoxin oxidoreductase subunit gamma